MRGHARIDLLIAAVIALAGSVFAYFLLEQPALIGMDDANITQVYARNLSLGHGYVYTPGHERVEGSTSLLWTLIVAAAFFLTSKPEPILLGITFALTAGSLFFAYRILDVFSRQSRLSRAASVVYLSVVLLGVCGFFAWNVLSLMDLALWTFLLNGLILALLLRAELRLRGNAALIVFSILSVVMGLARPEAMALVPIMLAIGAISEWRSVSWPAETARVYGGALIFSLLVGGLLAFFRYTYFGVPFPNTYYAKVSGDPIDNIRQGLIYLSDFNSGSPFADLIMLACAVCFVVATRNVFSSKITPPVLDRCVFILTAAIMAVFALTLVSGGDHFGSFRLMQPIYPSLFVVAFVIGAASFRIPNGRARFPKWFRVVLVLMISVVYLSTTMANFSRASRLKHEFRLAKNGRALGAVLNSIAERSAGTRVASITAGGIAMTYKGRIVDLMGLNWPKMAHATERRSGVHGHSAFADSIFWAESPELVLPSMSDAKPSAIVDTDFQLKILNGLQRSARFRKEYAPVAIPVSGRYVVTYARRDWVAEYSARGKIFTLGNVVP